MADTLDANGLTVKTLTEIKTELEADFRSIYGDDINIDQNSPDGQMIGIMAQLAVDLRELIVGINNNFDPDQASGVLLDQRAAINRVTRQGGSYTIQPIDITVDATVTLDGLDGDYSLANGVGFTVQDDSGNEFILSDTVTLTAGTHTKNFRAREIGDVQTTIGTITNMVTIVLGVTAVTNSSGALQTGADEESDASLRIRRAASVAISSTGYLNAIEAEILSIDGVTNAKVYENFTSVEDADGIPAHSVWCIVEGGANEDIADVIYNKKSYGSGMKGDVEVMVTRPSGGDFVAKFDRVTAESLHIRFDVQKTISTAVFDQAKIKQSIIDAISYGIGDFSETSALTGAALQAIIDNGGGGVPVNMEVSNDGSAWLDYLTTAAKDNKFVLDSSRITITVL